MKDFLIPRAERRIWSDTIALYLFDRENGKPTAVATEIVFTKHEDGMAANPFLELPTGRAQELMDELWAVGLRPSQGKQSEGVTEAQARHLEDMRALAFDKLKVEKPS